MQAFEDKMREGGDDAVRFISKFFGRTDPVHATLDQLAAKLNELHIHYAFYGDLAMEALGHAQTTIDVECIIARADFEALRERLSGLGYVSAAPGSRFLRDPNTGVRVKLFAAGEYPGDGKPKPVAFPDPAGAAFAIDGIWYLKREPFIEVKLAAGINNPGRLRDIADVQDFIRAVRPPRELAAHLHEYVRPKLLELWDSLQFELPER